MTLSTLAFAADSAPAIFAAADKDADSVRAALVAFSPLNAPGPTGDPNGRRETNWDAVPADFSNNNSVGGCLQRRQARLDGTASSSAASSP